MSIPKIIHQTWKTADIPYDKFRKRWVDSWKNFHPDWEYRLWTDEDNRNFIKNDYPWFLETYDWYPFHICRVDAVRCFMMHKYGGLYVDLDFECLKKFDPLLDKKLVLGHYDFKVKLTNNSIPFFFVPNALMMSEPGHPFWEVAFQKMIDSVEVMKKNTIGRNINIKTIRGPEYSSWVHYMTGPVLFSNAYKIYEDKYVNDIFLAPKDYFYSFIPFDEFRVQEVRYKFSEDFDNVKKWISPDAYAVTYWTASWALARDIPLSEEKIQEKMSVIYELTKEK